jgi:hypothetical protein
MTKSCELLGLGGLGSGEERGTLLALAARSLVDCFARCFLSRRHTLQNLTLGMATDDNKAAASLEAPDFLIRAIGIDAKVRVLGCFIGLV